MKSFKMKALAVAVLGLAGFGTVNATTCPTAVTTSGTTHLVAAELGLVTIYCH